MENEILVLAKAGYNRAEINEILHPESVAESTPPVQESLISKKEAESTKKNDFSEIFGKIENLEQRMFKENVQKSEIKESPTEMTLGEIMNQLIK